MSGRLRLDVEPRDAVLGEDIFVALAHEPEGGDAPPPREALLEVSLAGPGDREGRPVDLARTRWDERTALTDAATLERSGRYRVRAAARLEDGARIEAAEAELRVSPARPVLVALECDASYPTRGRARLLWLHDPAARAAPEPKESPKPQESQDSSALLFDTALVEHDPGVGIFRPPQTLRVGPVAAGTGDLVLPRGSEDGAAIPERVRIRREGARLSLERPRRPPGPPEELDLKRPPARLLRPALAAPAGEVDVFVIPAEGEEVRCLRFPPPGSGDIPRSYDAIPIEAPLRAFGASLGPDRLDSPRRIALLLETPAGLLLERWRIDYGWQAIRDDETPLPRGLAPLPLSEIALAGHDGLGSSSEAALLALAPDPEGGPARLALVRVRSAAREESGRPEVEDLGPLPAAPLEAAIAFAPAVSQGGPAPRLDWVVLLEDGRAVTSAAPDPAAAAPLASPPIRPLTLASLGHLGYVVCAPEGGPPALVPLLPEDALACGCGRGAGHTRSEHR